MRVKIQTASPTELLIMLFDGAIRFVNQAKGHMERNEFDKKHERLLRAQNIMLELIQALDQNLQKELYDNLVGLYKYCYDRLLAANVENDMKPLDDALQILEHLRSTWKLAVEKADKEERERNGVGNESPADAQQGLCIEG